MSSSPSLRSALSDPLRISAAGVLGVRIAYGLAMLAAPERTGRPWIGPVADDRAGQVALRGVGGREVAIHGVALGALLRGRSASPFLVASLLGDLTDLSATFAGRRGLPAGALGKTLAAGGASAAITAVLIAAGELSD